MLGKCLSKLASCARSTLAMTMRSSSSASSSFSSQRTHYCGALRLADEGTPVRLCGWVHTVRPKNFVLLRDIEGIVQVFVADASRLDALSNESVVCVHGRVRRRPADQQNVTMNTGDIEVECEHMSVLNEANAQLPFPVNDDKRRPTESVCLAHRYLDLRFRQMQHNLSVRSHFVHSVRSWLHERRFLDVETPTLFRRTPGGAREFLVPTSRAEHFYSLTQSPQQFKQLLMVGGLDRYYQIARCYRDESAKPDRQPEFTQIDIEMSFVSDEDIMALVESLLAACWPKHLLGPATDRPPFERMSFHTAMELYGVDKPDTRFDMRFVNVSDLVADVPSGLKKIEAMQQGGRPVFAYAFKVPNEYGAELISTKLVENEYKQIAERTHFPPTAASNAKDSFVFLSLDDRLDGNRIVQHTTDTFRRALAKRLALGEASGECSAVLVSSDKPKLLEMMGKLRLRIADCLDEKRAAGNPRENENGKEYRMLRDPSVFKFLWVVDFPLFTRNEDTGRLESTHHPFTAPNAKHLEHVRHMRADLDTCLGQHYDLVLNGCEIAGGSIRIHDAQLQRHVLTDILGEDTQQLEHLLRALACGAPPHGGIALGLDRLVAIMCGTQNIREVIAFPKAQSGRDLMSAAPSRVSDDELAHYHIACIKDPESSISPKS